MISRRVVQRILGLIWFIDGLLQLKPQMFTKAFVKQVILPTAQGQSAWISSIVNWGAHLVTPHIALWNVIFALVQIVLGLALLFNKAVKTTLVLSFIWTLIVWVFGEGFGQTLTGQALLLTGAPGGVLLYGLIGVAIWPNDSSAPQEWLESGIKFARYSFGIIWIIGCVLQFQGAYLTSKGFSQAISAQWLANMIGTNGVVVSIVLGVIEGLLGILLLINYKVRVTIWVSIVLSAIFWWVGQSFGQIFQPLATDFNSGLLMIVLSLCAYPRLLNLPKQRL